MQKKRNKKLLSYVLCIVLIAAMALCITGCAEKAKAPVEVDSSVKTTEMGKGQKQFFLVVVDEKGNESAFDIKTDKTTVGDALTELELIEGEVDQYGLYIKRVNGITADFNNGGKYWAFYVNGEYATSGVDTTEIETGATYSFKVQR